MPYYFKDDGNTSGTTDFDEDTVLTYLGESMQDIEDNFDDENIHDGDAILQLKVEKRFKLKASGVKLEEV